MRKKNLFLWTKLLATQFIANLKQPSDHCQEDENARNWTLNHCMPIGVLTVQNCLVSKESYRKLLNPTEAIFDLYTLVDPE